jgi:hypothetical protein
MQFGGSAKASNGSSGTTLPSEHAAEKIVGFGVPRIQ